MLRGINKKDKEMVAVGGLAGLFASLCCLGPVVLVALGLGGVSTALTIGKYSEIFTLLALLFFGIAVVYYLKGKDSCSAKGVKENWKIIVLSFVVFSIFLIILKYWAAPLLAELVYR
ncbi:MAG: hypothetical protein GOU98_01365 [Candidatus Altiarchaeota archaeon]|nr:hypothetical protein [Candidatus Altiarchaeota archaeon]